MPATPMLFLASLILFFASVWSFLPSQRLFSLYQPRTCIVTSTSLMGKARALNCDLTKQLSARNQTPKSAKELIVSCISQFDVDVVSFGAAMNVCNALDEPETCLEIFDLMKRPSTQTQTAIIPNRLCYSFVINACMQIGDFDKAEALFAECDSTYNLGISSKNNNRDHEHDSGLYNTIIASRTKARQFDRVLTAYYKMVELDLICTENTINHALLASLCLQRWNDFDTIKRTSLTMFDDLPLQLHPNPTTPHNSTTATSTSSVVPHAKTTVDRPPSSSIPRRKLVPLSEALYITLVKAAGARGNAILAFRYLQDAIKKLNQGENRPTRALFREVIQACHAAGDEKLLAAAKVLLEQVFGSGAGPGVGLEPGAESGSGVKSTGNNDIAIITKESNAAKSMIKSKADRPTGHGDSTRTSMLVPQAWVEIPTTLPTPPTTPIPSAPPVVPLRAPQSPVLTTSMDDPSVVAKSSMGQSVSVSSRSQSVVSESSGGQSRQDLDHDSSIHRRITFDNNIKCVHSAPTRSLYSRMKASSYHFDFNTHALPERGAAIPNNASRELLLHHCEKKALAYLLQHVDVAGIGSTSASTSANPPSSTPSSASGGLGTMGGLGSVGVLDQSLGNSAPTVHTHMAHTPTANRARATPPTPSGGLEPLGEASMQLLSRRDNELRDRRGKNARKQPQPQQQQPQPQVEELSTIHVNLLMCDDCHAFFACASQLTQRTLKVRDPGWLHTFRDGQCSCNGLWSNRDISVMATQ